MDLSNTILILITLFVFIFGTMVGSFMNVVLYRLHAQVKGMFLGRSYCPHCKKALEARDLIPIFSYIILRGKCRYCKKKISAWYPMVESVTGLVFVYIFWTLLNSGTLNPLQLGVYLFYMFILLAISFYDLKHYEIPDILILLGIGVALILTIVSTFTPLFAPKLVDVLIAVLITVIFFGGQAYFSNETWLGWGDVYIGVFMGLVLGWQKTLLAMFLSYIIGSIIGVALVIKAKKKGSSRIPFGPFLSLGTIIALGHGDQILYWYLHLLGA